MAAILHLKVSGAPMNTSTVIEASGEGVTDGQAVGTVHVDAVQSVVDLPRPDSRDSDTTWQPLRQTPQRRDALEEQRKLRGAPLYPYLFYARNPAFFRAAQGMWAALQQETTRVPAALRALLNRRVASWNGCEF